MVVPVGFARVLLSAGPAHSDEYVHSDGGIVRFQLNNSSVH